MDWSSWDGSLSAIPETMRGQYEPVVGYYDSRLKAAEAQAEEASRTFSEYMSGLGDDPRLSEYEQAKAEAHAKWESEQKAHGSTKAERDALRAEYDAYRAEMADAEVGAFLKANAPQAQNPVWGESVVEAMKAGWGLEEAASYANLHDEARVVARAAMERGAPADVALEYASLKAPAQRPKPVNPAVDAIAGADSVRGGGDAPSAGFRGMTREQILDRMLSNG
jgi:hypothetical protein